MTSGGASTKAIMASNNWEIGVGIPKIVEVVSYYFSMVLLNLVSPLNFMYGVLVKTL